MNFGRYLCSSANGFDSFRFMASWQVLLLMNFFIERCVLWLQSSFFWKPPYLPKAVKCFCADLPCPLLLFLLQVFSLRVGLSLQFSLMPYCSSKIIISNKRKVAISFSFYSCLNLELLDLSFLPRGLVQISR